MRVVPRCCSGHARLDEVRSSRGQLPCLALGLRSGYCTSPYKFGLCCFTAAHLILEWASQGCKQGAAERHSLAAIHDGVFNSLDNLGIYMSLCWMWLRPPVDD
ncbi:hypothetical protein BS78_05G145800 [Paspalum vaginatum]|nr:hypothetical protein BS78_05G145800 [Paspalum vaginatum]